MKFPYLFLNQGCLMTGRANGGSCVYNSENQTYSCVCSKLWTGDYCKVGKYLYYSVQKQE